MSDKNKSGGPANAPPAAPQQDENQIIAERRAKLAAARAQGQPFPNDFRRDALAGDLHARYGAKIERGARGARHRGRASPGG